MKLKLFFSISICALLAGCSKEQMPLFGEGHYVQFTTQASDTAIVSFFFYAGQPEVNIPLPVKLVGHMTEADLNYRIEVNQNASTALPKNYSLPSVFSFKKGQAMDSALITFKNSPELATREYILTIDIVGGDGVSPGQTTHSRKVFKINDMVSKPIWWDANMDRFYLGVYSERKYRKFMEVTGVGDLGSKDVSAQRELMLQFKYYLIDMKTAGTPVLEADGTDMLSTVPLIG